MKLRRPCANCPWRKDAPRGHWHPDHFTSIWRNCQDDGTHVMACHKTPSGSAEVIPCQGWVRAIGFDSIGLRILVMTGKVSMEEVDDKDGPELFPSFLAMMRANKAKPPARNRWTP